MEQSIRYTWHKPTLQFRKYFDSDKCRIFIIENISHNYKWLKECKDYIRDTDYFMDGLLMII